MYYFAYASNLSRKQMSERCPDAQPKFVATQPNHKLIFAGRSRKWNGGVASIKACKGEKVIGAIYEISERCLSSLNKCEGYPTTYNRKNIVVFAELGDPVEAITYVKVEDVQDWKDIIASRFGYQLKRGDSRRDGELRLLSLLC